MNLKTPPQWINKFILWYCRPEYFQEISGDMQEMYTKWVSSKGKARADLSYLWNAILFMRAYNCQLKLKTQRLNHMDMLQHTLKLSLRNIRKHKVYSIGNILGLAIGISVTLMIFLHVKQELSYEKAYPKHDRIFRVASHNEWAKSPPSMAEELRSFFTDVEETCRFAKYRGSAVIVESNNKRFISSEVFFADPSITDVFDLHFVYGNPVQVLENSNGVLITSSTSQKLFGNDNPVGKTLKLNEAKEAFEIQGVIEDFPMRSHIKADVLVSMAKFYDEIPENWTSSRGWMVMYTYALLKSVENKESFYNRMPGFMEHYLHEETVRDMIASGNFIEIMPLLDIHLKSDKIQEIRANSNIAYIYIFSTLAIFILVIACVNFINIFTTLSFKRLREVGLRKIVGANRKQLISQFLVEACTTASLSAVIGLMICVVALPYYNQLVDVTIGVEELLATSNLFRIALMAIGLGIISGLYPSILVTGYGLTDSVLGNNNPKAHISLFRKGLIVFQFALSLFILISTVVVSRQMNYIQNKDLGYDTDHLITFRIYGEMGREILKNRKGFLTTLKENPQIHNVSLTSNLMGEPLSVEYFAPAEADPEADFGSVNMVWTDENYLETMNIEVVQGRDFRAKTDTSIAFLVSQQLADLWERDVVGTMAQFREESGPIVGVFKNVNYYSLHTSIAPLVICLRPAWTGNVVVKIDSEEPFETIDFIESTIKEKSPDAILQFDFLDEKLSQLYKSENDLFFIFKGFSGIALIISCLGLLGIAAIEVQRRTKEVGIRKVLGASANNILSLLAKQFALILFLAIALSIPSSYYMAKQWLAEYSYAIKLSSLEFFLPSVGLIVISLAVVGLHSIKIIRSNPTESLRNE